MEEAAHISVVLRAFSSFRCQCIAYFFGLCCTLCLGHVVGHGSQYLVCHVLHAYQNGSRKTWVRALLLTSHGPKAICEVVVLYSRVRTNGIISTVVVGQHQALARNDFTCTETSQGNDGVLDRGIVDIINFFRGKVQAVCLHFRIVQTLDQHRQPHSFVGCCQGAGKNKG